MPFDWMTPRRPPGSAGETARRRQGIYLGALEERAALLQRLGYARGRARRRLAAEVAWDFELHPTGQRLADEIDGIVERVYGRGSRRAGQ